MPRIEPELEVLIAEPPRIIVETIPAEYEDGSIKHEAYLDFTLAAAGSASVDLTDLHRCLVEIALGAMVYSTDAVNDVIRQTRLLVNTDDGEIHIKLVWDSK